MSPAACGIALTSASPCHKLSVNAKIHFKPRHRSLFSWFWEAESRVKRRVKAHKERGGEGVRDPCLSEVSPQRSPLIQPQTDSVFNLFLGSSPGDWGNKNQYGLAGHLEVGELHGARPAGLEAERTLGVSCQRWEGGEGRRGGGCGRS